MSSTRLEGWIAHGRWTIRGPRWQRQLILLASVALLFVVCFALGRTEASSGPAQPDRWPTFRVGPAHADIPSAMSAADPFPSRLALATRASGRSAHHVAGTKVTPATASVQSIGRSSQTVGRGAAASEQAAQPSEPAAATPAIESPPPSRSTPAPAPGPAPLPAPTPAPARAAGPDGVSVSRAEPAKQRLRGRRRLQTLVLQLGMMGLLDRSPRLRIAPLLLAVAIFGYLAGHSRASGPEPVREIANEAMTARYSPAPGWKPVAAAAVPQIAGLQLTQPLAVAPGGNPAAAGLIVGEFADVESAPLPHGFLARLGDPPRGEAVELEGTPAYRYEGLETLSPGGKLTIFAIPSSTSREAVIACYVLSAPRGPSTLKACEGIAASMTLSGFASEGSGYGEVAPNGRYAGDISAAIGRVDTLRTVVAAHLRARVPPAVLARLASGLAARVTQVAGSLQTVEPPPSAEWGDQALLRSLGGLRDAYQTLALAARRRTQSGYAAALVQLHSAEAQVDVALSDFSLLGYQ